MVANERFMKNLGNSAQRQGNDQLKAPVQRKPGQADDDDKALGVGFMLDGDNTPDEEDDEFDRVEAPAAGNALGRIQQMQSGINATKPEQQEAVGKVPNISAIHGLFDSAADEDAKKGDKVGQFEEDGEQEEFHGKSVEPEAPPPRRKPGPKPKRQMNQQPVKQNPKPEDHSNAQDGEKGNEYADVDMDEVAETVLDFVCKSTVKHLIESYTSKIYTKEYAVELMQGYVDGSIDSQNPLFKQLVLECIQSKVEDPYLKGMTELVLNYIMEN
jgi:hypothetical protein